MKISQENSRAITIYNELTQAARELLRRKATPEQKIAALFKLENEQSPINELNMAIALANEMGYTNLHTYIKQEWNSVVRECCERWKEILLR